MARAIIMLDHANLGVGFDDESPDRVNGWEVHVRRDDGQVEILFVQPEGGCRGWLVKWPNMPEGESPISRVTGSLGDAFMQCLDPLAGCE